MVKRRLDLLAKAEADLKALDRQRPGLRVKTKHAHPVGYSKGLSSTLKARKAYKKRTGKYFV